MDNLKASKDGRFRFNERSGLVDDSNLNSRLEQVFGDLLFTELQTPFNLVAIDLMNGEKVMISERRVFDAIRASLAIPIIFPPWEVNGRILIDGAASDPLPIDLAIQAGADIIIAMGFPLSYRNHFRSITAVQEHLNNIYVNNILTASYAFHNLAHHAEIFPILPDFDKPLSMFDVDKIPDIIEKGAQATQESVAHIKRLLESNE